VPDDLKALYATAFEIDTSWLIEAASRRQKWIDQAQSLNLYIANPSGKKLDALYRLAWNRGLKTTYYLRSRSATHVEKSTLKGTDGKLNAVFAPAPPPNRSSSPMPLGQGLRRSTIPTCEACQ
jgi:ribonucleoside-diphosphate reductase alpha chain